MNKCLVCNHEWKFKKRIDCSTNNSRNCPSCFSYYWDFGNNVKCFCCKKTILNPTIHHKDRNHLNNSKENRISLCSVCHSAIHKNLSPPKISRKTGIRRFKNKGKLIKTELEKNIKELREDLQNKGCVD